MELYIKVEYVQQDTELGGTHTLSSGSKRDPLGQVYWRKIRSITSSPYTEKGNLPRRKQFHQCKSNSYSRTFLEWERIRYLTGTGNCRAWLSSSVHESSCIPSKIIIHLHLCNLGKSYVRVVVVVTAPVVVVVLVSKKQKNVK